MNAEDGILGMESTLLTTASEIRVDRVAPLVREYGGVCFPAHLDRPSYSVISSLGTFEAAWGFHAAELTRAAEAADYTARYPALEGLRFCAIRMRIIWKTFPRRRLGSIEECTTPRFLLC